MSPAKPRPQQPSWWRSRLRIAPTSSHRSSRPRAGTRRPGPALHPSRTARGATGTFRRARSRRAMSSRQAARGVPAHTVTGLLTSGAERAVADRRRQDDDGQQRRAGDYAGQQSVDGCLVVRGRAPGGWRMRPRPGESRRPGRARARSGSGNARRRPWTPDTPPARGHDRRVPEPRPPQHSDSKRTPQARLSPVAEADLARAAGA
jgi:hypothetical protein